MPIPTSRDWEYAVMKEALEKILELADFEESEVWQDYDIYDIIVMIYEEAYQAVGE